MSWSRTILFISFLIISLSYVSAQESVLIHGSAPDFKGKTISLIGFTDPLSERKEWLTSSAVDDEGNFTLQAPCQRIRYAALRCDHVTAFLYIQPGADYAVLFPSPEDGVSVTFNDKANTELIFNELDLSDINSLIIDFNFRYEGFFAENYAQLQKLFSPQDLGTESDSLNPMEGRSAKGSLKILLDRMEIFMASMDTMYAEFDQEYFKTYRNASLADLFLNSNLDRRAFFDRFIAPVQHSSGHRAQLKMESRFFSHYFLQYARLYGNEELGHALNDLGSYAQMKELMLKDDFLQEKERRDVVLCMALAEVWQNKSMETAKLGMILQAIADSSENEKSASLAADLYYVLSSGERGFKAYSFSLLDQFKDRISIENLNGKPIAIEFWAEWCSDCQAERKLFSMIADELEEDVYFISINMDDLEDIPDRIEKEKKVHTLLGYSDPKIKEVYRVNSLPQYVLIDENGLIYDNYAPRPSQGLKEVLIKLKKSKATPKRPKIGSKEN